MKEKKLNIKAYGITALIGLGITAIAVLSKGIFSAGSAAKVMMILADAFTLSGGLLIAAWVFAWVSGEGVFDMFSYTAANIRKFFTSKKNSLDMDDRDESYGDFVERRKDTGRGRRYFYLLIVGGVYFALGIVFSVLFYQV